MSNPLYVARELEHLWNDAGCTVAVVADYLYANHVAEQRHRLPVERYVIARIADYLRFPVNWFARFKLKRTRPALTAKVKPSCDQ